MNPEYRMDIKIRNNLILRRINELGYDSIRKFCIDYNLRYGEVCNLISLKIPAIKKKIRSNRGKATEWSREYIKCAESLAIALKCVVDDLFTERQKIGLSKTTAKLEFNEIDALRFADSGQMDYLLSPYLNPLEILEQKDLAEQSRKAIATLTPREEKVLRMRFGIGEKSDHKGKEIFPRGL